MDNLIELAIEAALKAGQKIMNIYNMDDFKVEIKEDNSPLTLADNASNNIINEILEKTGLPILSEENIEISYDVRKKWNKYWLVDPLDGTKEFIKKNDEFTVNIALIENGKPVFGVVYLPVSKELYYGCLVRNIACKVVVSEFENLNKNLWEKETYIKPKSSDMCIRIVGSRSHMNKNTEEFISMLKKKYSNKRIEIVSKGSSLKFCVMAEGKADVYPRFAPTMEWDTAAGQAICEAVGLKVIDQSTKNALAYNKESLLNNSFLVQG